MSKTKFLVRQIANSLYLVVSKNKEAVRTKQVIGKKECVVGGYEHLVVAFKQSLANLIGKFVVVESIKFVDEDERSVVHLFQPIILQLQISCACGCNPLERNSHTVHYAEERVVALRIRRKLILLTTNFFQISCKVVSEVILYDILFHVAATFLQANEFTIIETSKEQHILYEVTKLQQDMIFGEWHRTQQEVDDRNVVGTIFQILNGNGGQAKFFGNSQFVFVFSKSNYSAIV